MKLTVLGSGTLVPDGERNSAGYFIETGDALIMLDCGAGTLHALSRYQLPWQRISHLFISHFHIDHVGELASLFFAFRHGLGNARSEPLTVIGPKGLDRLLDGLRQAFGSRHIDPRFPIELRMVTPGERVELGRTSILSVLATPHTEESLAVRIDSGGRSICYTGDTAFSEELAGFFDKTELLVSECSFRERQNRGAHLSVEEAAKIAAIAGAARLLVTHFYFDVDDKELTQELQRQYKGTVLIGRDGMVVEL